jgi:hypothetical protein
MPVKSKKSDTKKVFLKKGACSHTLFYILNREFGFIKGNEEGASDPLAGGIAQEGYQCGMLWGAALGAGAESFRRNEEIGKAIVYAITAAQHILESFVKRTKSPNCSVITSCDFNSKFGLTKFFIMGKPITCLNLADKWAPEAIESAKAGLSMQPEDLPQLPISCASEVVKKMGANNEEIVMVAGFAGGYGLSGNACGALSAAIWMKTLSRVKEQNYKYTLSDPYLEKIKEAFFEVTDYKMECWKICGQKFDTINEHTEFIKNGGCNKLIDTLAQV